MRSLLRKHRAFCARYARVMCRATLGVCLLSGLGLSQQPSRSDFHAGHHRLICVVPLIGAGTVQDPRRPLLAPIAAQIQPRSKPNPQRGYQATVDDSLFAYHSVLTDHGQFAIVMFTAQSQAAVNALRKQQGVLRLFDSQSTRAADLIPELRKFKKDFDLQVLLQGGGR